VTDEVRIGPAVTARNQLAVHLAAHADVEEIQRNRSALGLPSQRGSNGQRGIDMTAGAATTKDDLHGALTLLSPRGRGIR
jgi:hypothetical protein